MRQRNVSFVRPLTQCPGVVRFIVRFLEAAIVPVCFFFCRAAVVVVFFVCFLKGESKSSVADAQSAVLALARERGGGPPHVATNPEVRIGGLRGTSVIDCFVFSVNVNKYSYCWFCSSCCCCCCCCCCVWRPWRYDRRQSVTCQTARCGSSHGQPLPGAACLLYCISFCFYHLDDIPPTLRRGRVFPWRALESQFPFRAVGNGLHAEHQCT